MAESSGGGVLDFGNPGIQFIELRRMTVPTRERKVFLGGGIVDIGSTDSAVDELVMPGGFDESQDRLFHSKLSVLRAHVLIRTEVKADR
jgi:hypothetical protein